jgi:hypothetical protein
MYIFCVTAKAPADAGHVNCMFWELPSLLGMHVLPSPIALTDATMAPLQSAVA